MLCLFAPCRTTHGCDTPLYPARTSGTLSDSEPVPLEPGSSDPAERSDTLRPPRQRRRPKGWIALTAAIPPALHRARAAKAHERSGPGPSIASGPGVTWEARFGRSLPNGQNAARRWLWRRLAEELPRGRRLHEPRAGVGRQRWSQGRSGSWLVSSRHRRLGWPRQMLALRESMEAEGRLCGRGSLRHGAARVSAELHRESRRRGAAWSALGAGMSVAPPSGLWRLTRAATCTPVSAIHDHRAAPARGSHARNGTGAHEIGARRAGTNGGVRAPSDLCSNVSATAAISRPLGTAPGVNYVAARRAARAE